MADDKTLTVKVAVDGSDFAQIRHGVGQLQIIADRWIKRGTEDAGSLLAFVEAFANRRGAVHLHGATVAGPLR